MSCPTLSYTDVLPFLRGLLWCRAISAGRYPTGKRRLPDGVPLRFVPSAWRPFILRDGIVDRAADELCALSRLRERLRAGDIWVAGSRQFRDFDSYLIDRKSTRLNSSH